MLKRSKFMTFMTRDPAGSSIKERRNRMHCACARFLFEAAMNWEGNRAVGNKESNLQALYNKTFRQLYISESVHDNGNVYTSSVDYPNIVLLLFSF